MEIDELIVTNLRDYLMEVIGQLKESYEQLNIDFLSNEPNNYSLDKIPVQKEVEKWIIGPALHRNVYNFRSRMEYSADVLSNIENIGFYEHFERIIEYKNDNNELPEIKGIESIKCLNAGTMRMANTNTAEFYIQIQIEYRDNIDGIIASI